MLKDFEPHLPIWFTKRIGEDVEREASIKTPQRAYNTLAVRVIKIASPAHAKACYLWHKENKVNFNEVNKTT